MRESYKLGDLTVFLSGKNDWFLSSLTHSNYLQFQLNSPLYWPCRVRSHFSQNHFFPPEIFIVIPLVPTFLMKLFHVSTYAQSFYRKIQKQLLSTRIRYFRKRPKSDSLYKRISPLGDPNVSIEPVLDQWIREGNIVKKTELQNIINELRVYKRFKHALEVC